MNRSITPLILIILAIGTYFTFTRVKIDEVKAVREVNKVYQEALANSETLIKTRDNVLAEYNKIDIEDREALEKLIPDNIDNVRLIIDTNAVAARHGLVVKNIKTNAPIMTADGRIPGSSDGSAAPVMASPAAPGDMQSAMSAAPTAGYNTVTLSFSVKSNYETFVAFMKDLEKSLRVMDISRLSLSVEEGNAYEYAVEIKTYWLKTAK